MPDAHYTHLSEQERVCIFHQQMHGFCKAEMGRRLNRHRSTIGRELHRFHRHPSWPAYRRYFPDGAHSLARERRSRPRGFRWTRHRPLLAYVLRKLRAQWSPEQISGRLQLDFPDDRKMRVSHQSIYSYIRADRAGGGSLWKHLRQSHKRRRKAYRSGPRRSRIPDRIGIEQRPADVRERKQSGHWEADTMLARRGRLATCVERKSRYVLIARLPDGTACQFNTAAIRLFRKIPRAQRKTLTSDNGSEFVEHKKLAGRLGFKTFFADPYASWQRGTNENTNGLIRQYLPRTTDLSGVSPVRVARIAAKLNNRPRKCLGYKTPAEVIAPVLHL
jgi:IS30 family transposase